MRLAADEAVEVLKAAAAGGPGVGLTGLVCQTGLLAFAELRRGVAVQLQRLGNRGAWCWGGPSCSRGPLAISVMPPMPTVVVASAQHRLRGRAGPWWKRLYFRPSAARRSAFGVGGAPPNALDGPKPTSSEDDEDVRRLRAGAIA